MSQQHDDDGTVIRPRTVAPAMAHTVASPREASEAADQEDGLSLPIGTRIGEFEILRRIGDGGFSIVYLARDHSLERTVALKEYMPSSLATRVGVTQVQPRSQRHRDTFEAGLKSFVNEAKLLAQFDHPALVKVHRFWESHGTAYMAMPFYQGVTVKDAVRAMPERPDEAWLLGLLAPLTEALMVIHAERCFHRDIAPDNVILLASSGKPLLLDFGAARRVIGDMTQGLTVILKAGYAPVEQYAEIPGMKQGPWTDVYALAAVVYWAITGSTPPASVGRMMSDSFVPLSRCAAGRYSESFLRAIDRALEVLPEQRTQNIAALRNALGLSSGGAPAKAATSWDDPNATVIRAPNHRPLQNTTAGPEARPAPISPEDVPNTRSEEPHKQRAQPRSPRHDPSAPTVTDSGTAQPDGSKRPARLRLLGAAAAVTVIAITGVWWATRPTAPEPAPGPAVSAATEVSKPDRGPPQTSTPPATEATVASAPASGVLSPASGNAPIPTSVDAPNSSSHVTVPVLPVESTPQSAAQESKPPRTSARGSTVGTAKPPSEQLPGSTQPVDKPKAATPSPTSANAAECARILQRFSLGDTNPQLAERLKALKC